ncbi:MAG TPA: MOSC N-terminal beta barrel domain-containing protein [Ktedonobacterales bacterium]
MLLGRVKELWRYPVKSMRGERLGHAEVGLRGVSYDRGYALLDQQTGKIASAKHPRLWGRLLHCQARLVSADGVVCVRLPHGEELRSDQGELEGALSTLTGRRIRLLRTPPETPEIERYWPDVDGLALRDTVTSGAIGQGAPEGTFFDYAPLHLMTTATLAHLQSLYAQGQIDVRRFRPNLVIEAPEMARDQGFIENAWVGQIIQIGDGVRLRVTTPVPRCVVPTLPQGDLVEDIGILRAVARHNRPPVPALGGTALPCLGVYASYVSIERAATIHVGDVVRLST